MDRQTLTDLQAALRNSQTSEWSYLAEGGAHLVFAYRGPSSSLHNKVLRIRKEYIASSSSKPSESGEAFETARRYFASSVTPALVPASLLPIECRLTVDAKWVQQLEQESLDFRSETRLSLPRSSVIGGDVDLGRDRVLEVSLVENLLGGEGDLAIEIKPKCGFLPDPRYLSVASKPVKTKHCRFCMHQAMREAQRTQHGKKMKHVDAFALSQTPRPEYSSSTTKSNDSSHWDYCPLDLFSTERKRRRRAVDHLFDSWTGTEGKGNNFRIFVSGKALDPSMRDGGTFMSTVEGFASRTSTSANLVEGDSSKATERDDNASRAGTEKNRLCGAIVDALDRHRVLPLLKALQQEFDPLGIEELGRLSRNRAGRMTDREQVFDKELLEDPSLQELDAITEIWSRARADLDTMSLGDTAGGDEDAMGKANSKLDQRSDLRTLLVSHGISAIFKDCSIVIRFPGAFNPKQSDGSPMSNLALDASQAVVKLIDLDLKPLKKANKWYELDDQIWRSYLARASEDGQDGLEHPRYSRNCCT